MAIDSFRHAGLEKFAKEGCLVGVAGNHAFRLNNLLAQLSLSGGNTKALMEIPGFHSVKKHLNSPVHVRRTGECVPEGGYRSPHSGNAV